MTVDDRLKCKLSISGFRGGGGNGIIGDRSSGYMVVVAMVWFIVVVPAETVDFVAVATVVYAVVVLVDAVVVEVGVLVVVRGVGVLDTVVVFLC